MGEVMPTTFSRSAGYAALNPYGTYKVWPTDHGISFQVRVSDPAGMRTALWLFATSVLLAGAFSSGAWHFTGLLLLLLLLDTVLFACIAPSKLIWIEVRPDGLAITSDIDDAKNATRFFNRSAITRRTVGFDEGVSFRFGIHDLATPPFVDEREFEIFQAQFEQACARLWLQENVDI